MKLPDHSHTVNNDGAVLQIGGTHVGGIIPCSGNQQALEVFRSELSTGYITVIEGNGLACSSIVGKNAVAALEGAAGEGNLTRHSQEPERTGAKGGQDL